jgi:hypothetical protein
MATLFQLVYISTAREDLAPDACQSIVEEARGRNAGLQITGLLLFNGKRFLQALEGEEADVRNVYRLIEADPRHHGLVIIGETPLEKREFSQWSMAFAQGRTDDLPGKVDAFLGDAGTSTRDLFMTSAKLYRGASTGLEL